MAKRRNRSQRAAAHPITWSPRRFKRQRTEEPAVHPPFVPAPLPVPRATTSSGPVTRSASAAAAAAAARASSPEIQVKEETPSPEEGVNMRPRGRRAAERQLRQLCEAQAGQIEALILTLERVQGDFADYRQHTDGHIFALRSEVAALRQIVGDQTPAVRWLQEALRPSPSPPPPPPAPRSAAPSPSSPPASSSSPPPVPGGYPDYIPLSP